VSVKDSSDAIGFFGTGLKYAIAILLREGCKVTMFAGGDRYEFLTVEGSIRGQAFDLVAMAHTVEGEPVRDLRELGFTTQLGKTWDLWQAFRELYCNTLDEHGEVFAKKAEMPECFEPAADETWFVIEGRPIDDVWQQRDAIFLSTDPVETGGMANAHTGPGNHIYYRGIRVADLNAKARYDYNIHQPIDLTEDRTVKYQFQARRAITSLVLTSTDRDFLYDVLTAPRGMYEFELDFLELSMTPGDVFLSVVGELREKCVNINNSAVEVHRRKVNRFVLPEESIQMTKVQIRQLERASAACSGLGIDVDRYPIVVVESLGRGVWGRAENFTIYLAVEAFALGTKVLAGTLFEEYIHLAHHLSDESREMQNWLIDRLMTAYEDASGEPL